MPVQDYLPSATLPPHLSPFAVSADPLCGGSMGMADALKQAAAVNSAPGFGAGSTLYRPPEMDYLAGLVSLAETRISAVAKATDSGSQKVEEATDDGNDVHATKMEVDGSRVEGGMSIKNKKNKKKKKKNAINKVIKKGE